MSAASSPQATLIAPTPHPWGVPLALVAASAILYAAAQPPWDVHWLGWVCLVPLLAACARTTPLMAAGLGAVFGLAVAAAVTPWLPQMMGDYFSVGSMAAWPTAAAVWFLLAVPAFTCFGFAVSWVSLRGRMQPFAVAGALTLAELARAHGAIAAPWALLGYSQPADAQLSQLAAIAGPYAPGLVLGAVNAAAAGTLVPSLAGASPLRSRILVGLVLIAALAYGEVCLRSATEPANRVEVAVVQGAVPRNQRFVEAHHPSNLAHHLRLTADAAGEGARVVFWPELALDFHVEGEPALRAQLERGLLPLGIELVTGGLGSRRRMGRVERTNSVFLLRDGEVLGRTDKVRLMPFSETRPLPDWLDGSDDPFASGDLTHLLHTSAGRVGVITCSEASHPSYVRQVVGRGAELLANPSNDDWFGGSRAARGPLRAAAQRAVETRRWLVRPTAGGHSVVVDPWGRVVAAAPHGTRAAIHAVVEPRHELTPYVRFGDAVPFATACALVLPALRKRAQKRPTS